MARSGVAGWVCALALGGWLAPGAAGATIVPTFQERSVFADASATADPQFSSQANGDGAKDVLAVEAGAVTAGASSAADASQTSSIGAAQLEGGGGAAAEAESVVDDGLADAAGDSFLRITFEVSEAAPYRLIGNLFTNGAEGFTRIAFEEASSAGPPLFEQQAQGGESFRFLDDFDLLPGVSYELLVIASAAADAIGAAASEASQASFDFAFFLVPEPASAALLALGLVGLTASGAAARRRSPRAP